MKALFKTLLFLFSTNIVMAQSPISISPLQTQEYCPNTNTIFTVTISGYQPSVFGWTNNPIIVSTNYPPVNVASSTTFSFIGKFQDVNIAQTFGVLYKRQGINTTYKPYC